MGMTPMKKGTYQDRARSARAQRACALRALGLLLADGTPTVGGGKTLKWEWPKTAKNRGDPQKMTPSSETEIFLGVVPIGKL